MMQSAASLETNNTVPAGSAMIIKPFSVYAVDRISNVVCLRTKTHACMYAQAHTHTNTHHPVPIAIDNNLHTE